jgi:hypothetical protein
MSWWEGSLQWVADVFVAMERFGWGRVGGESALTVSLEATVLGGLEGFVKGQLVNLVANFAWNTQEM